MIAATDYMKAFADQIRPFVPGRYRVLGTDGFGRSDYRRKLRAFFEVDRHYVAVAALKALADEGTIEAGSGRRGDRPLRHRPGEAEPSPHLTGFRRIRGDRAPNLIEPELEQRGEDGHGRHGNHGS